MKIHIYFIFQFSGFIELKTIMKNNNVELSQFN